MLPAAMNGVDQPASDGETYPGPPRGIAGLGALGGVSSVVAAALAARGRLGLGAVAVGIAGAAMFVATMSGRAQGWPSRWTEFVVTILGRAPDAAVMAGVAWHFRLSDRRVSAVAVSAIAITFLAAYARTRAMALGWPSRTPSADQLRYGAAFAALAVPGGAEAACWILAFLTFMEFVRVAAESWRHAEGA
jgi:hypothetical protein